MLHCWQKKQRKIRCLAKILVWDFLMCLTWKQTAAIKKVKDFHIPENQWWAPPLHTGRYSNTEVWLEFQPFWTLEYATRRCFLFQIYIFRHGSINIWPIYTTQWSSMLSFGEKPPSHREGIFVKKNIFIKVLIQLCSKLHETKKKLVPKSYTFSCVFCYRFTADLWSWPRPRLNWQMIKFFATLVHSKKNKY